MFLDVPGGSGKAGWGEKFVDAPKNALPS